jgi:hypothetical protein
MPDEIESSGNSNSEIPPLPPADADGAPHITDEDTDLGTEMATKEAPPRPKTEFERKLGMAGTWVQIFAIIIGGAFGIWKFGLEEQPTLQDHLRMTGHLTWDKQPNPSVCLAEVDIDIENKSKSNIEVKQIRGYAWYVEKPSKDLKGIQYYDIGEHLPATAAATLDYRDGPLIQRYVPGQSAHNSFEWFVEPKKDSNVLFVLESYRNVGDSDPLDFQRQWDSVCGDETEEAPK